MEITEQDAETILLMMGEKPNNQLIILMLMMLRAPKGQLLLVNSTRIAHDELKRIGILK